jgi:hypothetical protein
LIALLELSSFTVAVSFVVLGMSLIELTVMVTIAEEVSPFESELVYSKASVPLKFGAGV